MMTRRGRLAGALVAAGLVPGLLVVGSPQAQAGTGDDKVRVVQHNTDMGGPGTAIAEARRWGDVDAVTFQELCESQARRLRSDGWKVMWRPQRGGMSQCGLVDGKRRKGNAIATRRRIKAQEVVPLNSYGGRDFKLLCANLATGVAKSWVCTTHLALGYKGGDTYDDDGTANRGAQVALITGTLNQWVYDGRRVVLTGDLNESPTGPNIARLHRVGPGNSTDTDKFWEGDQSDDRYCPSGQLCQDMGSTTDGGRRIDYAFASWRGVNAHSGMSKGVVPSRTAGHHIVRAQVTFRPLG